jgi:hypothetical protein
MFAIQTKKFSQIQQISAIQFQSYNGRASGWSQADDLRKIFAPFEMFFPNVAARIIKRNCFPGFCVNRLNPVRLKFVAARTRQGKIGQNGFASFGKGENMFDFKS